MATLLSRNITACNELMHVCMEVHVNNYGLEFNIYIYVQRVDTSASM